MPWRVVLDSRLALSARSRLAGDEYAARTIVLTTAQADPARRRELIDRGVQVA